MALEIQIWQGRKYIIMPDTANMHISFQDSEKDMLEAITLSPQEFFNAINAFKESKKVMAGEHGAVAEKVNKYSFDSKR